MGSNRFFFVIVIHSLENKWVKIDKDTSHLLNAHFTKGLKIHLKMV